MTHRAFSTGETLWSCSGTGTGNPYSMPAQGVACDMTPGSSGGGWITGGSLNSVTSFEMTEVPRVLWGPYFGSTIQSVYNAASVA